MLSPDARSKVRASIGSERVGESEGRTPSDKTRIVAMLSCTQTAVTP
jgi:hypothetical protein